MTSRAHPARVERAHGVARSPAQVRAMLARFQAGDRPALERLVASHPYFTDLLWSFPGIAHAFVRGGDEETRSAARQMIAAGAPLGAVARCLGVPQWLRRLPPEAYRGPLPKLPSDASFALHIANHLPQEAKHAHAWLATVAAAFSACDAPFAVWAAREFPKLDPAAAADGLAVMGLFAWYSARAELTACPLRRRWHEDLGAFEASEAAHVWLHDLEMSLYAQVRAVRFGAANPATSVRGITFHRLATPQDLVDEGAAMHHCVGTYAAHLVKGCSAFWSLSENGAPAATLQVRLKPHRSGRPFMCELLAAHNAQVPHRVWSAVQAWLADWGEAADPLPRCGCILPPDLKLWLKLWKPYWLAKGTSALLPMRPNCNCLGAAHGALERWMG